MKMVWKSALGAGVIAASLAGAATAAEQEKGFYVGGNAFYTQVFDADGEAEVTTAGAFSGLPLLGDILGGGAATGTLGFETTYDDDWGYGLNFGYKFANPWRVELEYREQENDIDEVKIDGGGTFMGDDSIKLKALFGNFWYDFNMKEALRPYVGFGIGRAELDTGSDTDDVAIFQVGAGVSYLLSPRLALDVGYRYAEANDPNYKASNVSIDTEYSSQSVVAGVRYNFFDAKYGVQDQDGDGVPDEADQCPNTPTGVQVDSKGCPLDGDGDGVPDYKDKCPNTPAGAKVNADGCQPDSDGDGVTDADDMCPDTPAGQPVMSNGCAEKQAVILHGVNFELNSAKLTNNAQGILDGVADTLTSSPGFNVELQGHTDSTGSDSYNLNLSQNRAQSVKNYLVDKGVTGNRLTAKGYGETMPIATNETKEGRAENRRVELKVLGQDSTAMVEDGVMVESDDPYDYSDEAYSYDAK